MIFFLLFKGRSKLNVDFKGVGIKGEKDGGFICLLGFYKKLRIISRFKFIYNWSRVLVVIEIL